MNALSGAAMLPKRVGLPMARPAHSSRSRFSQKGGPFSGIEETSLSKPEETLGTVRRRACMPGTRSTPSAIRSAMRRTEPPTL
jgi:hypothetical protein